MGSKGTDIASSNWISNLFSAPKPPQLRCGNWLQLDAQHAGDHSKETGEYVNINPGSEKELCWSTWISIPHWDAWDARFVDKNAAKDGCVAWFEYEGIDRVYGPFLGNRSLAFSNMPGRWRLGTNCQIIYYQW